MDVENLKYYANSLEKQAVENKMAAAVFRASFNAPPLTERLDGEWLKEAADELHDLALRARKLAAEIKAKIAL